MGPRSKGGGAGVVARAGAAGAFLAAGVLALAGFFGPRAVESPWRAPGDTYRTAPAPSPEARDRPPQEVPAGRALVEALGCAGCHAGVPEGGTIREAARPFGEGTALIAPAYLFHYLADPQAVRPDIAPARMPRYELDERQRVALALFVTNDEELRGMDDAMRAAMARHPDADRAAGAVLFETLNCAGCHAHPDVEARVTAPDLSATGVRVREDWLAGYLSAPVTIRPAGPVPGRGGQMPDFRLSAAEAAAIAGFLLEQRGADVAAWEPLALSPFAGAKAEALLRDRWSCLGCHQLGEDGGRIGPRLDGIADRLQPVYVRALIEDPEHLAPGTVMPASLEQPDRMDLIASYLVRREGPWVGSEAVAGMPALPDPGAVAVPGDTPSGAEVDGGALYTARCAPCHGLQGGGDGFNAPFLPVAPTVHADSAAMSERPDDTLYDSIHAGGWILGKSHRMPAFGASLDHEQKRALVAYIRVLCRCQGPPWSRDGRRGR